MSEPEIRTPPNPDRPRAPTPPDAFDHNAALRKYLALLDTGIEWCCAYTWDQVGAYSVAARLIKTSVEVGAALNQAPERQFTHRIVVEHVTSNKVGPHLPRENLKTIHGVAAVVEPQDVDARAHAALGLR